MKTIADVEAFLRKVPDDASVARRWQAVRTATRALLGHYGVPKPRAWTVAQLPSQAYSRYGDCASWTRTIRYRREHVEDWWVTTLSATIVHEVAHAIADHELGRLGKRQGPHGKTWTSQAAAMGLREARHNNLPEPSKALIP